VNRAAGRFFGETRSPVVHPRELKWARLPVCHEGVLNCGRVRGRCLNFIRRGIEGTVNHQPERYLCVPQPALRARFDSRGIYSARRVWSNFRRNFAPALALILAAPLAAAAQGSAPQVRITGQIDEGNLTRLRGNTHPLARPQFDQGAVADSQPIRRMLLLLQRSPEQETALRTLIDQQQTKASTSFHKWLTPGQFGQQFGAAPADIQTVTDWLQSHGFQVARVAKGGTLIEFSGTAGQVRAAFHTEIHRYTVNGETRFANSSDPQIPVALAGVVAGPVSLHSFPRKALNRVRGVYEKDRVTGKVTPVPSPLFSFSDAQCSSNPIFSSDCYAIGLGDFATIYNVNPLYSPGINGHIIDGSGQTIAIVGDSEICTASSPDFLSVCGTDDDVKDFRSLFGLSTSNLPTVILDGPDPGFTSDEIEGDLDVEWSGAIAKNAKIDFVIAEPTEASQGTDLAAEYVVDNNLAPVLSESFGNCEPFLLAGGNLFESSLWEQAAAQGITVVVSTGDSGSAGCDDSNTQTTAVNGASINGVASTPFNVAAGGTDFDFTATNYPAGFWSTTNSTVNGIPDVSAKSYIPETSWNDSCARTVASACNAQSSLLNITGAGGGQSSCVAGFVDNTGNIQCPVASYTNQTIPGWTKPPYQLTATGSGLNAGNDLTRDVPDISLFSSVGNLSNSFYIVCNSNLAGGPCVLSNTSILFVPVGGTSAAAPAFAGIMALVNQNMEVNHAQPAGQGQGNANYVLYPLFAAQQTANLSCNSSSSPVAQCTFNDVTKGNNSVPCAGGSLNCSSGATGGIGIVETGTPANTPSYTAGTGYDLATGLGSVNVFNLVSNWPTEVGSFTPTTTTLCLSFTSGGCASSSSPSSVSSPMVHGTSVYVSIGVTSSSGAPPAASLAKAEDIALIGTFPAGCTSNCTTQGVDRFDPNSGNVDVYSLGSGGMISASTTELVGGTYTVNARYGGDGKFGSSTSTPGVSITITPESSTASVSVLSLNLSTNTGTPESSVPYGALNLIRADVHGASGLETATGSVTMKDNNGGIVDPSGILVTSFALNTEGYTEDQTPFLTVGSHSFTAQYVGDASYSASAVSTAVPFTVTLGPTTTSISSSATSIPVNGSVMLTAFVDTQSAANPSGGSVGISPSGTVTFKSGSTTLGSGPVPVTVVQAGDLNGFDESTASLTVNLASTATITATYSGDPDYSTSTTASGVTINVGTPGINVSSSGCTGATITIMAVGQSGTCLIAVTGANGFAGTVALTAPVVGQHQGDVDLPSCTFGAPDQAFTSPNTITLSSTITSGNATMTCSTRAASGVMVRPSSRPSGRGWPFAGLAVALAGLLFLVMVRRERRWSLVPIVVLLAVVVLAGVSCNGGGNSGLGTGGNPGTTPDTYTVTVTATPMTPPTPAPPAQTTIVSVVVQ
jgi:hypothetical protein